EPLGPEHAQPQPQLQDAQHWGDVYPCPHCGGAVRRDFQECPNCGERSVAPARGTGQPGVQPFTSKRKDETEEEAEVEKKEKDEGASVLDALESSREGESSQHRADVSTPPGTTVPPA